jgi:hypothetical protein
MASLFFAEGKIAHHPKQKSTESTYVSSVPLWQYHFAEGKI